MARLSASSSAGKTATSFATAAKAKTITRTYGKENRRMKVSETPRTSNMTSDDGNERTANVTIDQQKVKRIIKTYGKANSKSSDKPKGLTKGSFKRAASEGHSDDDVGEVQLAIEAILGHEVYDDVAKVDLKVKLKMGDIKWEYEQDVQEKVPRTVYQYYKSLGGRQAATGLDMFHAFKILAHRYVGGYRQYKVQWTGYRPQDFSWEPEEKLADIHPSLKAEYDASKRYRK